MDGQTQSSHDDQALAEEGRSVRAFIESSRSGTMLTLFDFLLEQSLQGNRPKETGIAEAVFHESWGMAATEGSRVRVGIHRLRKKLDFFYEGKSGPRLVIPKGEYGLILEDPKGSDAKSLPAQVNPIEPRRFLPWMATILLIFGNVALALILLESRLSPADTADRSPLWQGFDEVATTKIVLGDYFMFLSKEGDGEREEPTQDLKIHDADDFHFYKSRHPGSTDRMMQGNPNTVSIETLESASKLWPVLQPYSPNPIPASELNAAVLDSSSIIYVGALDALSPLIRNPLFRSSHFQCIGNCYELIDKSSRKRFLSDSPYILADRIVPRRDYGYIASFPGPSGKQILIISGTGEAGVSQMVSVVTNPKQLKQLDQRMGGDFRSFEALYQVRTMFAQDYTNSLVAVHPLDTAQLWDKTSAVN